MIIHQFVDDGTFGSLAQWACKVSHCCKIITWLYRLMWWNYMDIRHGWLCNNRGTLYWCFYNIFIFSLLQYWILHIYAVLLYRHSKISSSIGVYHAYCSTIWYIVFIGFPQIPNVVSRIFLKYVSLTWIRWRALFAYKMTSILHWSCWPFDFQAGVHARIQIYCIFRHLKLELLTQFPASNDEKYINVVYIWRKFVSFYGYVHWRMTTEISVMYGSEKVSRW